MAARLNPRHQEMVKDKIKTSQLINSLCNHALGEIEMTQTQIRAAEILLNKTLPNLKASDDSLTLDGEVGIREIIKEYTKIGGSE